MINCDIVTDLCQTRMSTTILYFSQVTCNKIYLESLGCDSCNYFRYKLGDLAPLAPPSLVDFGPALGQACIRLAHRCTIFLCYLGCATSPMNTSSSAGENGFSVKNES